MINLDFFYLLSPVLGYVMQWLYMLVNNYGWAIIIFTFIVRIAMFPLSMKQQKSQTRMAAHQPMIKEIQKKWANDRNRQTQEVQKFYQENNLKMAAGCAPMLINFLVIFGIIGVIQSPLEHILRIDEAQLSEGYSIVNSYEPEKNILQDFYTQQTILTDEVKKNPKLFTDGVDVTFTAEEAAAMGLTSAATPESTSASTSGSTSAPEQTVAADGSVTRKMSMSQESVDSINDFNFSLNLFGNEINLAVVPDFSQFWTLILPILSLVTMALSQVLIMFTSGQQAMGKASMWAMTIIMGVMFGFFAFRVPIGFSLYYTVSNIVMTIQQMVLRRMYNPVKIREQVEREIEERRAAKKNQKKKVLVQEVNGELVSTEVSEAELNRARLERARAMDAERYKEESGPPQDEDERAQNARNQDELRYSGGGDAEEAKPAEQTSLIEGKPPEGEDERPGASASVIKDYEAPQYKPGRRKRARNNKGDAPSTGEQSTDENNK